MADLPADRDQRAWREALDWLFVLDRSPGDRSVETGLQDWLDRDPAHARAWREARAIWDLGPRLPEVTAPPSIRAPAGPSRRRWLV
ncbi:MAG: FecR/PupR family sigma factor regulator, partial [Ferrovibrionaceae bacterium]